MHISTQTGTQRELRKYTWVWCWKSFLSFNILYFLHKIRSINKEVFITHLHKIKFKNFELFAAPSFLCAYHDNVYGERKWQYFKCSLFNVYQIRRSALECQNVLLDARYSVHVCVYLCNVLRRKHQMRQIILRHRDSFHFSQTPFSVQNHYIFDQK